MGIQFVHGSVVMKTKLMPVPHSDTFICTARLGTVVLLFVQVQLKDRMTPPKSSTPTLTGSVL